MHTCIVLRRLLFSTNCSNSVTVSAQFIRRLTVFLLPAHTKKPNYLLHQITVFGAWNWSFATSNSILLLLVIIIIIIIIHHELGLNRPLSAPSNSLFKGLWSRLVHLVYNSAVFWASCCLSLLLHVHSYFSLLSIWFASSPFLVVWFYFQLF
jgi:hypothetical protein